jgi:hypothetical protein
MDIMVNLLHFLKHSKRLDKLESLLNKVIADKASSVDGQNSQIASDDALKRKKIAERKERMRLKERLRKSLSAEKSSQVEHKFLWQDYLFGISAADQRSGKEGSRSSSSCGRCTLVC